MSESFDATERIRQAAYQRWLDGGRRDGTAAEDWLSRKINSLKKP
ncbi:hypothetical protein ETAA8_44620 [Anatilimnocola aggregata]|uniref:DUF2934 domain-containing protein n=1 Tax=Anatilimnocola aggregata TaxID=2528021 RepID=A0A517YGJ7_9BACT|nr:DUF2934 domain-containing protein [Anatilimnocola aggregata]QDU29353.1 hypothetical protein ETAA8_44620 [Anatilimnocola aggregata]